MSRDTIRCLLIVSAVLSSGLCTDDDRIIFPDDAAQNNPQPQPVENDGVESRFLPINSKFSIGLGENTGHSIGISRNEDGISLSQSTSLGGNGPISGSKSNSLSFGKSGLGVAGAGAYNVFGQADTNSNAFSLGDATADAQADVKDGKVSSGAKSSVGTDESKLSSGASSSVDEYGNANADSTAEAAQGNQYSNRRRLFGRNPNGPLGLPFTRPFAPHRDSGLRVNVGKFHGHAPHQWQNGNGDVQIRKERPSGSGLEVNVDRYNPHDSHQWNNRNNPPHGLDINIGPYNPSGPNQWNRRNQPSFDLHTSRPYRDQSWNNNYNCPYRNCGGYNNQGPDHYNQFSQGHFGGHQQNYQYNQNHQFQPNHQNQYYQNQPGHFLQPQFHQPQQGTRVSAASSSASASSSGTGHAFGQSSSQSNSGPGGPSSQTTNQLHTSGNAQSHAQGAAAGIQQNPAGQTQASFSSGLIGGNSRGPGSATGSAISSNRGEHSRGEAQSSVNGPAQAGGTANAAGVSFDDPPNGSQFGNDFVPSEFVRSGNENTPTARGGARDASPVRQFLSDVRGSVREILHQ